MNRQLPGIENAEKSLRRRYSAVVTDRRDGRPFRPLQGSEALLYAARCGPCSALFLGSSAVEHSTVNRMVAGSNPARGAIHPCVTVRAPSPEYLAST